MSALCNTRTVALDRVELAAVLAGLRLLQSAKAVPPMINHILTDCGEFDPLAVDQIDTLCERISTGEAEA